MDIISNVIYLKVFLAPFGGVREKMIYKTDDNERKTLNKFPCIEIILLNEPVLWERTAKHPVANPA